MSSAGPGYVCILKLKTVIDGREEQHDIAIAYRYLATDSSNFQFRVPSKAICHPMATVRNTFIETSNVYINVLV